MNQFLCRGAAGCLSRVSVTAVLLGLAALAHPAWAWATDSGCGRVYLANTQNELLRLRSTAEIFEAVAEFGGRNRSVASATERSSPAWPTARRWEELAFGRGPGV